MSKPTKVSKEDFNALQALKANVAYCKSLAKTAAAELRAAEAETQNAILRAFIKYEMALGLDEIDPEGNIVRVEVKAAPAEVSEKGSV